MHRKHYFQFHFLPFLTVFSQTSATRLWWDLWWINQRDKLWMLSWVLVTLSIFFSKFSSLILWDGDAMFCQVYLYYNLRCDILLMFLNVYTNALQIKSSKTSTLHCQHCYVFWIVCWHYISKKCFLLQDLLWSTILEIKVSLKSENVSTVSVFQTRPNFISCNNREQNMYRTQIIGEYRI